MTAADVMHILAADFNQGRRERRVISRAMFTALKLEREEFQKRIADLETGATLEAWLATRTPEQRARYEFEYAKLVGDSK